MTSFRPRWVSIWLNRINKIRIMNWKNENKIMISFADLPPANCEIDALSFEYN